MTRDQKIVGIGAASGVTAMVTAIAGIYQLWPTNPSLADGSSRLAYALQADAFAVLPLLIGIMTVGNSRFLSEAIDPTLHKEDLGTQINCRVVENTLQQYLLFLIGTLALSVNLTAEQMRAIPAAALVFIVARNCILDWLPHPSSLPRFRHGGDRIPQRGHPCFCTLEDASLSNSTGFGA